MPIRRYPSCLLRERELFLAQRSPTAHLHFTAWVEPKDYRQDDIRDCWLTLCTAIILSSLSLFLISLGIAKFNRALKMTTQSSVIEMPESVRQEALSYLETGQFYPRPLSLFDHFWKR